MKRLTRDEFESRFPRRTPTQTIGGVVVAPLKISRDTEIAGVVNAPVVIENRAHVIVTGHATGPITVGPDAVLWCDPGLVEGEVIIHGAAFLSATVGHIRTGGSTFVYDPCEPADSESGG